MSLYTIDMQYQSMYHVLLILQGTVFPLKRVMIALASMQTNICVDLVNKFIWKLSLIKSQMSVWSSKYLDIIS